MTERTLVETAATERPLMSRSRPAKRARSASGNLTQPKEGKQP